MIELSKDQREDARRMALTPDLPNFSLPGTGKTHTTLQAISLSGMSRNLILCPKIAVGWWAEQAAEYLGADVGVMKAGTTPPVGEITVTTYDIARNAREILYEHFDGGTLTLDESQYVCNPDAGRTQAIFGNRTDLVGGLAERFDTVWCLSGTPMQNFANDYYTQVAALHPGVFENYGITNYDEFCRKFTYKAQRQYNPRMQPVWKIVGSSNEALLNRIIYDDIKAIRRVEAEGLPKLRYRELRIPVSLPKEIRAALRGMSAEQIIAAINDPDSIAARAWKLTGLAKVEEVVPYVGDSYKSSPILLGCWHHEVMDAYLERFEKMGLRTARVDGAVSDTKRADIRTAFNQGFIDVLVGQMKAMGVSWNLQEASNHVIIAEEHPSPAVVEQFYKRVYRRGQERDCTVDLILADGLEIDEAFNAVRKRKEESSDKISGGN